MTTVSVTIEQTAEQTVRAEWTDERRSSFTVAVREGSDGGRARAGAVGLDETFPTRIRIDCDRTGRITDLDVFDLSPAVLRPLSRYTVVKGREGHPAVALDGDSGRLWVHILDEPVAQRRTVAAQVRVRIDGGSLVGLQVEIADAGNADTAGAR